MQLVLLTQTQDNELVNKYLNHLKNYPGSNLSIFYNEVTEKFDIVLYNEFNEAEFGALGTDEEEVYKWNF